MTWIVSAVLALILALVPAMWGKSSFIYSRPYIRNEYTTEGMLIGTLWALLLYVVLVAGIHTIIFTI